MRGAQVRKRSRHCRKTPSFRALIQESLLVIATALLAATSSVALAQGFDPNLANRYPSYAEPVAPAAQAKAPHASLQSAPVQLRQGRNVGLTNDQFGGYTGQSTEIDVDRA